ncbi:MAG: alpha/beta hydrolase [Leptolyngbyaceae bacterium]|nr:alpha/beta hydrolase [Leptolyngbyaceae bacterium]
MTTTQYYQWRGYRCAYEKRIAPSSSLGTEHPPLVLIHPVGVGLYRQFWHRFCQAWQQQEWPNPMYLPDLLGCGDSDMPAVAYRTEDWAAQLCAFLKEVVQQPAILVVQGALFPVAIALAQIPEALPLLKGLVLSGPPAWAVMTTASPDWQRRLLWNGLFEPPVGPLFYRYARRRQFLYSFSVKQLFAEAKDVDANWLDMLETEAAKVASRYAVFSFLAGYWRQDHTERLMNLQVPTLVVVGDRASSISRSGKTETPVDRVNAYLKHLPQAEAQILTGRNVLPYESTSEFVKAIAPFVLID